ncbi:MAG TPA: endonuclease domain-containing protein [bacterium]
MNLPPSPTLVGEGRDGGRYPRPLMPRFWNIPKANWQSARDMRGQPTQAEKVLWEALRSYRTQVKFRRQHLIGRFIVDFYAPDIKLVIEVDGGIHRRSENAQRDQERTVALEASDCRVIRFSNDEVLSDLAHVVEVILREVSAPGKIPPLIPPLK